MASISIDPIRGLVGAAFLASVLTLIYTKFFGKKSPYPLPPGPPGKLFVGNLGQLSIDHPEQDYIRWGKEYSKTSITCRLLQAADDVMQSPMSSTRMS